MNPKIVKLKDTEVVIGLEWELLNFAVSERKAVREVLKKNPGVKSGVLVRAADVATLGMMPSGHKRPAVPSGAALLALANQEAQAHATGQSSGIEDNQWVVVERLTEDEFWVVDVKDGVPLPGSDFVGGFEKVRTYLTEMLEGTGFKVFTTDEEIQAAVGHLAVMVPKDAAELIASVEKPSLGNLKTLSGVDPNAVLAVLGLVVLGLAYFGWSMWDDYQTKQQQQAAAAARASADAARLSAEKEEYAQAVRTAVLTALDQAVAGVNLALKSPSPREVIHAWYEMVGNVPLNHSGWRTQRVECLMETPTQPVCTVFLKRTVVGLNRVLMIDYPQAEISGDDASYVIRGPELVLREASWGDVDSARVFMGGLMSDLQFIRKTGLNYSQGESKDITQAVAMPTPPASLFTPTDTQAQPAVAPINTGMARGDLALGGDNLWLLTGLSQTLDRTGVALDSLSVDLADTDSQPWSAQGSFMVRTLPAPVIPVIDGPGGPITVDLPEKYRDLVGSGPATGGVSATTGMPLPAPAAPPGQDPADPDNPPAQEPLSLGLPDAPSP